MVFFSRFRMVKQLHVHKTDYFDSLFLCRLHILNAKWDVCFFFTDVVVLYFAAVGYWNEKFFQSYCFIECLQKMSIKTSNFFTSIPDLNFSIFIYLAIFHYDYHSGNALIYSVV